MYKLMRNWLVGGCNEVASAQSFSMPVTNLLPTQQSQSGFSLLEILIALTIVGVLSSIAVPKFQALSAERDVEITASEMAQQMEAARVFAQNNGVTVVACRVDKQDMSLSDTDLLTNMPDCNAVITTAPNSNVVQQNAVVWPAWVWFVRRDGVNTSVWQRGPVVPSTVTVESGQRTEIYFNKTGQPIDEGNLFTNLTVTVRSNINAVSKQITVAQSGRIKN